MNLQAPWQGEGKLILSTLEGELGGVEYDFFDVISRATERGLPPEEIQRAYQAALSQAFDKPEKGRPRGSTQKSKNLQAQRRKMRQILISEPTMPLFTAADQVLEEIPGRERYSSRHLVRTFKKDKKEAFIRGFLQIVRGSPGRPDVGNALHIIDEHMRQAGVSPPNFQPLCTELQILEQQYISTGSAKNLLQVSVELQRVFEQYTLWLEERRVNKK
jgi:hypothetical protein